MDASGFGALRSPFPDRTVVTYDPRGLGRSTRNDGRVDHSPAVQADDDVHTVIDALGAGPVEMFARVRKERGEDEVTAGGWGEGPWGPP